MTLDARAKLTPDRWSMERFITTGSRTILFKPYRALTEFAVFVYSGGNCETAYDGADEQQAITIFNQLASQ